MVRKWILVMPHCQQDLKSYVMILKSLELDKEQLLYMSNTRELNRDPFTN